MRIPLIAPEKLTDAERPVYEEWKADIGNFLPGFTTERSDGALIGPFNAFISFPDLGHALYGLFHAINSNTTLPPLAREVVILLTGARYNALFETFSHEAVAKSKGMDPVKIYTLAAGQRPNDLTVDEAIAFDVTSVLLRGGQVPSTLYEAAEKQYGGLHAIAEIACISGCYAAVCNLLNVFDIAIPQTEGLV